MPNADCRFCILPDKDRIVASTKNFTVMLSLGPIVEGYVVVVSREHYSCCAALPPALLAELRAVQLAVSRAQIETYGQSMYFEHGRSGACVPEGHGEDHCFHAHLHVVPATPPLLSAVEAEYPVQRKESWADWRDWYENSGLPYLAVQADQAQEAGSVGVVVDPPDLPRQYLRSRFAELMGVEHLSDWAAFPSPDVIAAGVMRSREPIRRSLREAGLPLPAVQA